MKILIVSQEYAPTTGGVAVFIRQLADGLVQAGHSVGILTASPRFSFRMKRERDDTGARLYRVPSIPYPFDPHNNWMSIFPLISTHRAIRAERPDCIHMHTPTWLLHLFVLWWARWFKIPVVATNHVMPENVTVNNGRPVKHAWLLEKIIWFSVMNCVNRALLVTAPTQVAVNLLQAHGLKRPARAITCGVDVDFYSPGKPDPATLSKFKLDTLAGSKLLYVGRLDGEKRIDLLISALPAIRFVLPDTHLIIAGRGKCAEQLAMQAKELGLTERITFTGFITDPEKRDLLRAADLFVTASPAELQCIAGLEALACGLPLVVANVAALTELCEQGVRGYQFSYPDVNDLAIKVIKLLQDKPALTRSRQNSRDWAVTQHAKRVSVEQYTDLYQQAVNA